MTWASTASVEWVLGLPRGLLWRKHYLFGWVNAGLFEKQKPNSGLITSLSLNTRLLVCTWSAFQRLLVGTLKIGQLSDVLARKHIPMALGIFIKWNVSPWRELFWSRVAEYPEKVRGTDLVPNWWHGCQSSGEGLCVGGNLNGWRWEQSSDHPFWTPPPSPTLTQEHLSLVWPVNHTSLHG